MVWTIACDPGGASLLQLPVTGVASAHKPFAATFIVPASGCPTQWLRLTGVPGDVATAQSATITALSIDAEAGQ